MSTNSTLSKTVVPKPILLPPGSESVTDRQERVPGYRQEALTKASALVFGVGGLGGLIALWLVKKGLGRLEVFDFDVVDPTNFPRTLFTLEDIWQPKSFQFAKLAAKQATSRTVIVAHAMSFQDALATGMRLSGNVAVVAVD